MVESTPAHVNPIEVRFSNYSKYHYFVYFVVFSSKIPAIWHILNLMILNPPMTYTCGTDEINVCPCDNPVWDRSVFTETAQTKFGLICDRKYEISLSETLTYFGMLIGAMLFGVLSDRYGRLKGYCISYFVVGVAGILVSLSPNTICFFIFRFCEGVGAGGNIVTSFVVCIEYAGKYRETITALYHIPLNIGHMSIAGVSYFFRNSFTFELIISIPMFIYVFAWCCLSESPLWLLGNNNKEKAIKAMEKIARFNNQQDPTIRQDIEAYYNNRPQQAQVKIKLHYIFKYRQLTINFFCMAYLYIVCGMGYYGVSQYISKMSKDIYLNIFVSGTLVVPGTLASVILLNKIGRKPFLTSTSVISGVCMIIAVLIPTDFKPSWLKLICACTSNCFFFMSFIVVFLYGVEMFPTQVRNSVLGFLSLLSRAGMMAAPQINSLSKTVAGFSFGILALIGGVLTIFLPETKNTELPSTLEEAETMYRK